MWGKVSCLRKQHDGRDWALNHRPSDLKSNLLTTTPPGPHRGSDKMLSAVCSFCVASWNEDHIAITRWSLCVDIDPHFSGSIVVYFR